MAVQCPECGAYQPRSLGQSNDGQGPTGDLEPGIATYNHVECTNCPNRFTVEDFTTDDPTVHNEYEVSQETDLTSMVDSGGEE